MGKRKPTPTPLTSINMNAGEWYILHSVGMPQTPTQVAPTTWKFAFPKYEDSPTNEISYLMHNHNTPIIKSALSMSVIINATEDTIFDYATETQNTCVFPAHVRLVIQKDLSTEFGRWWSNPLAVKLEATEARLVVPLSPDQWTSVYGRRGNEDATTLAGFKAALNAPQMLGMTFGGGCFFGHGVRTKFDTALFTCSEFALI